MQIEAMLCDFATVREGLLHVLGGGINRLWRDEFPAQMSATLALLLEIHSTEMEMPHTIHIFLQNADGARLAAVSADFQVGRNMISRPGEHLSMPLIVSLQQMEIPSAGAYSVDIVLDNQHKRSLTIYACLLSQEELRRRGQGQGHQN